MRSGTRSFRGVVAGPSPGIAPVADILARTISLPLGAPDTIWQGCAELDALEPQAVCNRKRTPQMFKNRLSSHSGPPVSMTRPACRRRADLPSGFVNQTRSKSRRNTWSTELYRRRITRLCIRLDPNRARRVRPICRPALIKMPAQSRCTTGRGFGSLGSALPVLITALGFNTRSSAGRS